MELRRICQTTLAHPVRPEFSVSTLFVPAKFPEDVKVDGILEALELDSLSGGSISESELKRVIASILSHNLETFDMNEIEFRSYVNKTEISMDFLNKCIHDKHIVIEEYDFVRRESMISLLNSCLGAALSLYSVPQPRQIYDWTGRHKTDDSPKIELLALAVPHGMVICGSIGGMCRALPVGLYQRIHATFLGKNFETRTVRRFSSRPLDN